MTVNDRRLFEFLDARAGHAGPDYLNDILARTRRTRQRPAWTSIERWLPVDISAYRSGMIRPLPWRTVTAFVILALLVAVLVAVAVASRRPLPPPYGLAANGPLVLSVDGDLYAVEPGSWKSHPIISGGKFDFGATYSRDGSKIMFLRADRPIADGTDPLLTLAVANADGTGIRELTSPLLALDWLDWSPDGSQIVFVAASDGERGVIHVANTDGSGVMALDLGLHAHFVTWLPPDGREIVFRSEPTSGSPQDVGIYAVRPDGTGLRMLSHERPNNEFDYQSLTASPDGRWLSFTRWFGDGRPRVFLLDVASGDERILPTAAGMAQRGGAAFSPDGKTIAYAQIDPVGTFQAVVAPLDGSNTGVPIGPTGHGTPAGGEIGVSLAFSPDGTALIERLGADDDSTYWWLPIDGSAGSVIGAGSFAFFDVQRLGR